MRYQIIIRLVDSLMLAPRWFVRQLVHYPLIGTLLFAGVLVVQLLILRDLPYARARLESASEESTPAPNFRVGSIDWDVTFYETDPVLEPLRDYYRAVAGTRTGLEAAIVICHDFANRFPFGHQPTDFFSPDYRLLEDFRAHVERGEPAHCVSRSGLLAAIFLASGQPARVVQIFPDGRGKGHNITEVWDGPGGWQLVDPSTMRVIREPESDVAAGPDSGPERLQAIGRPLLRAGDFDAYYFQPEAGLLTGPRVYPEPWLYMRTGPRASSWPFNGRFAVSGSGTAFGPAQWWCRVGICVSLLGLLVSASVWARRMVLGRTGRGPDARPTARADRSPNRARALGPSPGAPCHSGTGARPGPEASKKCVAGACVCGTCDRVPVHD
jgi:hypothetical protein